MRHDWMLLMTKTAVTTTTTGSHFCQSLLSTQATFSVSAKTSWCHTTCQWGLLSPSAHIWGQLCHSTQTVGDLPSFFQSMVSANPGRNQDSNGQENHKDVRLRTSSCCLQGLKSGLTSEETPMRDQCRSSLEPQVPLVWGDSSRGEKSPWTDASSANRQAEGGQEYPQNSSEFTNPKFIEVGGGGARL